MWKHFKCMVFHPFGDMSIYSATKERIVWRCKCGTELIITPKDCGL